MLLSTYKIHTFCSENPQTKFTKIILTYSNLHIIYSTITDPRLPLKLTVKDKNEPLGQIIIPVDDLPSDEHFLKWVPLGPHRKNPHPYGEICLDCWIEDFYDESEGYIERENLPTLKKKKNGRLRQKFLGSIENLSPRAARKASVGMGVMSVKGSVSMEDISGSSLRRKQETLPPKNNNYLQVSSTSSSVLPSTSYTNFDMRRANSTLAIGLADQRRLSMGSAEIASLGSLPVIKEQTYPPKITNFIPNSGSAEGGTLIQITGKNLGLAKEDIIRLMVAGCNCISTLEYYTPNKIMCTTTESEGIGPISITTRSGGTSSSKLMYEFVASKKQEDIDLDILDDGTGKK